MKKTPPTGTPHNLAQKSRIEKRIGQILRNSKEIDEQLLRDKSIRQLQKDVDMAFRMAHDPEIDLKTRQSWFEKHTDAVLALTKVLKDRQEKDWDTRLQQVEEYRSKALKQTVQTESANSQRESETQG